ncbi:MAG: DUF5011 domain-containing protein [Mogibacterium sp.]|nr:DUF5011 domain-containing protein [Mogibacterium sp.]
MRSDRYKDTKEEVSRGERYRTEKELAEKKAAEKELAEKERAEAIAAKKAEKEAAKEAAKAAKAEADTKAPADTAAQDNAPQSSSAPSRPHKKKSYKKLIRILLAILVLVIAIVGFAAYSYKTAEDSLAVTFTEEAPEVEFGSEHKAMDFVKESEGVVTTKDELLDTETAGQHEVVYTATKSLFGNLLNPTKDFTLTYNVIDKVEPLVLWSGDGTVLEKGSEFDINEIIAYGDNADPKPAVDVEGKVDMKKNGDYPLHVTVTDSSGNKTDWDLTVTVADNVPQYTDDSARTKFGDFVSKYNKTGKAFGIDVSTWQGDIDFEKVKAAGCDFVIIRAGYSVDGVVEEDGKFDQNYKNAKAAGLEIGLYLYSYDNTEQEVRTAADWIITKLGGEAIGLPVAFDWEDFGSFQSYEMNFRTLNKLYDAFADELAGGGYDCMLYGSKNYLEKVWDKTDTRPVWLAHYTDETDYEGPYNYWQASCTGRIDGIDGDVDMNVRY